MKNQRGNLFILSGPSGIGKDTVLNEVLKSDSNIKLSISTITRPMREGEVAGEKYNFISRQEFLELLSRDEFLEYNEYVDNYYGTPKTPVLEWMEQGYNVILEIDVNGAMKVKEKLPQAVMIFMLPRSLDVIRQRLIKRGTESARIIEERIKRAATEVLSAPKYDYVFFNDELSDAVDDLKSIIKRERSADALLKENMQESLERVMNDAESFNRKTD